MQPLQDNVALWARSVSKQSGVLKWILSYHLAHVANLIVIFICMCFSAAWDQVCSVRLEIEYHTFSKELHLHSQHVQRSALALCMLRLHRPRALCSAAIWLVSGFCAAFISPVLPSRFIFS